MIDPLTQPARAKAETDLMRDGVRIVVSPKPGTLVLWDEPRHKRENPDEQASELLPEAWLHLQDDVARALYEALAEYYGHDVVNARQLRRDYDAERARVDKLIGSMIDTPRRQAS